MKKNITFIILMSLLTIQTSNIQAVLPMRWFYPLSALTIAGGIAAGGLAGYHAACETNKDHVLKKEEQTKRKTIGTTIGTALGAGLGAVGAYLLYCCTPAYLIKNIRYQFGKIEGDVQQENSRLLAADWPDNEAGFNQAYGADRYQVHDVSNEQFQNLYKQKLTILNGQRSDLSWIETRLNSLGSHINNLEHPDLEKIKQLMQEIKKRIEQAHKVLIYFDLDQIQKELHKEDSKIVLGDTNIQGNGSDVYPDLYSSPDDQFIAAAFTADMSDLPLHRLAIGYDRLTNKVRKLKLLADKCNEIMQKSPLWAQSGVMNEIQEKIRVRINNVQRALEWLRSQESFEHDYRLYQDSIETKKRNDERFAENQRYHRSIEQIEQKKLDEQRKQTDEQRKQTAEVCKQTHKLETLENKVRCLEQSINKLEQRQNMNVDVNLVRI